MKISHKIKENKKKFVYNLELSEKEFDIMVKSLSNYQVEMDNELRERMYEKIWSYAFSN